jgi:hypothetical protein
LIENIKLFPELEKMLLQKQITIITTILLLFAYTTVEKKLDGTLKLVPAFPELTFIRPVDLQDALNGNNRLYVVERAGCIYCFAKKYSK